MTRSVLRADAVALPRRIRLPQLTVREWLRALVPSRRSLAIGFGIVGLASGGYLLARETSLFAIDRIEVTGGSPRVAAQVRQALRSFVGVPLVGLDGAGAMAKVDALPTVVRASYDRAFPHTLRVSIVPERPAAVLRRGPDSWLVSARGRVVERLPVHAAPRLPRVWVPARTPVRLGSVLDLAGPGAAARAVALAGSFAPRIASASYSRGSLVFRLRSGIEVVLGDLAAIRLKVVVAKQALGALPPGAGFLDVSVPGRPVAAAGAPNTAQGSGRG